MKINKVQFEKLCNLQCNCEEVCKFFNVTVDELNEFTTKNYDMSSQDAIEFHNGNGLIAIREAQFKQADKNPIMAIWLGKQYLGQTEESTVNQNVAPIVIKDDLF